MRDETWDLVNAVNLPFCATEAACCAIMWEKVQGNAYYILARQYIAAVLNVLAGASTTDDVDDALVDAAALFAAYTPETCCGDDRSDFISAAETLADYNEGTIGPGHCDD
jgi:hypothetical protein